MSGHPARGVCLGGNFQHAFGQSEEEKIGRISENIESEHIPVLHGLMSAFWESGRKQSATFAYWDDFLRGATVLLHMLHAEREGCF